MLQGTHIVKTDVNKTTQHVWVAFGAGTEPRAT